MNIGIDARLIQETGVGRYIRNLIRELSNVDSDNTYVVFLLKKNFDAFVLPNKRWQKRIADVRWHSVAEQVWMPIILLREKLDLVHIPYFNAPIFYPGKFVITIHDLIILHFDTGNASTLPYFLYKLRRLGYSLVLRLGIKRASHILTVSDAVKQDILTQFAVPKSRVTRSYEGVDPIFLHPSGVSKNEPREASYFLYIGNVYPHKNIDVLLQAYTLYRASSKNPANFVFVGPSDYFYEKLKKSLVKKNLSGHVFIKHNVSDESLVHLYEHAISLIFPSKMEGFGLPALEAIALGCRVIASDIPVFREILGDHAVYIELHNPAHFAFAMKMLEGKTYDRISYQKRVAPFIVKFNWQTMAIQTRAVYEMAGDKK